MWFKQVQLFKLDPNLRYTPQSIIEKLEPLAFRPCLPSMPHSIGWVTPFDDDHAPLLHAVNGNIMLCLQVEEKILPATVIRHELAEKIKKIKLEQDRRVGQKEKLTLKDEIVMTLLPRAFTKFTRFYAYIDTKNNWLVLNTTNQAKTELFISLFKKSITENIKSYELNKLAPIITHWLKTETCPDSLAIEKSCVLQDPDQQNRVIRCQQQDLFSNAIQSLVKEGCEVKQLALSWNDRMNFVLSDEFKLSGIKYAEEIISQANEIEVETKAQQFDADFVIMSESLSSMLSELLDLFIKTPKIEAAVAEVA